MPTRSRRLEPTIAWTRRTALFGGMCTLLGSCSSDSNSDTSQMVQLLRQSLGLFSGGTSITREEAAAIPYASIGVRLGDGPQTLLILETAIGDKRVWTSASRIAIETQSGRIVRTGGLPHNMAQNGDERNDPLQNADLGFRRSITCSLDLPDRDVYGAAVHYEIYEPKPDSVIILGSALKVLHLEEHGSCPSLNWEFDNEYWIEPGRGLVWRSLQNVHPDLDVIEIVTFRPPA